jgi:hypothetical protein
MDGRAEKVHSEGPMKITKVETFLVRWGDVSRVVEAVLGDW